MMFLSGSISGKGNICRQLQTGYLKGYSLRITVYRITGREKDPNFIKFVFLFSLLLIIRWGRLCRKRKQDGTDATERTFILI